MARRRQAEELGAAEASRGRSRKAAAVAEEAYDKADQASSPANRGVLAQIGRLAQSFLRSEPNKKNAKRRLDNVINEAARAGCTQAVEDAVERVAVGKAAALGDMGELIKDLEPLPPNKP